jgi:hypothetical protein
MKNPNSAIYAPPDFVNLPVRDPWIEGYLEALESWRRQAGVEGKILAQLRAAWRAYGQYRATADPFFRWSAWRAIQNGVAALPHVEHEIREGFEPPYASRELHTLERTLSHASAAIASKEAS